MAKLQMLYSSFNPQHDLKTIYRFSCGHKRGELQLINSFLHITIKQSPNILYLVFLFLPSQKCISAIFLSLTKSSIFLEVGMHILLYIMFLLLFLFDFSNFPFFIDFLYAHPLYFQRM